MNPSVWLQACRVEHNRLSWYIRDTSWGGLPEGRDSKCWSFSLFFTYFVNWIKSFFSKHSRLTWVLWYTLKSIASSHKHGWCQYKQEGGCFPNKVHPCWQRLSYKKKNSQRGLTTTRGCMDSKVQPDDTQEQQRLPVIKSQLPQFRSHCFTDPLLL